jgi:hypothetical protein
MEPMVPEAPTKAQFASRLHFPDGAQFLQASDLPPRRQESTAITIRWYLS